MLVTGTSGPLSVYAWSVPELDAVHRFEDQKCSVLGVLFLTEDVFVSGGQDNIIRLWNVKDDTCKATMNTHHDWVKSLAISPSGCLMASGSFDNTVKIYDCNSISCTMTIALEGRVHCLAFLIDDVLLFGIESDSVKSINTQTGEVKQALEATYYIPNAIAVQGNCCL